MDNFTINYGNQKLDLKKSKKYIAVKPRIGTDKKVLADILPNSASTATSAATLGGFQLINVEDYKKPLENTLDTLRSNPAISSGTHVFETSKDQIPFVPTGQIYIEYSKDASIDDCMKLLDKHNLSIVESRGEHEIIAQITPSAQNPVKTAYALQQSPLINVAEPEFATPGKLTFTVPADTRIIDQWHLRNTGNHRGSSIGFKPGADARVIEAWKVSQSLGSPNVTVAVIDDGFDLSHPDLTGTSGSMPIFR